MRVRVSTTVDAERLDAARRRSGLVDSQLIDRALDCLLDELDAEAELAAIASAPYHTDDAVSWGAPAVPSLPYDGEIPADVIAEVRRRRAACG